MTYHFHTNLAKIAMEYRLQKLLFWSILKLKCLNTNLCFIFSL